MAMAIYFEIKVFDVIVSVHNVANKILSNDSTCIVYVIMWPKFGNSSTSMREVIITSLLLGFDLKNHII